MGMAPIDIMRPDPTLYMSPAEVLAMFNDGGVDVGNIFPSEYMQQQQQQSSQRQTPQPPPALESTSVSGGFAGASFQKMNGLVASP
jgi:hypothetical protein